MKLKERIERGQTLIMEHKLIVERMENRLTQLNEHRDADEPITLSVMSQIEFYILNLKVSISMNESALEDMIQQEKYEKMQESMKGDN